MANTNSKKISKGDLENMLAKHRVNQFFDLYNGHEDDALYFVRHHLGPTRKQLLLSAQCFGLVSWEAK